MPYHSRKAIRVFACDNQSRTASQTANVTVTGVSLTNTGTTELPASAPSSNSITGLGNSFSVKLPAYTMAVLVVPLIPPAPQNTAPVLASLPNQTVNVGQSAGVTPSVTDSDLPAQTFTFKLLSAPDRTTLNTNTGVFHGGLMFPTPPRRTHSP